jgi:hypothetical protein
MYVVAPRILLLRIDLHLLVYALIKKDATPVGVARKMSARMWAEDAE